MTCKNVFLLILVIGLAGCAGRGGSQKIVLNDKEFFEGPGYSFLVYHNNYSPGGGFQAGLQMFLHGERLLDSGTFFVTRNDPADRTAATATRVLRRKVDRATATATVYGEAEGINYQVGTRTDGQRMFITLKLDKPVDWSKYRAAGFRIYLYPAAYFMKSFQADNGMGIFPRQYPGKAVLLDGAHRLRIAAEDPLRSVSFARASGTLQVLDNRGRSPQPWFSVVAPISGTETEVSLEITPHIDPAWRRAPVIGVSQVGYHPKQQKEAVLELDPRDATDPEVNLYTFGLTQNRELVKSGKAKPWGRFLYYQYSKFDFSDVRKPGIYMLETGGRTAGPFRIGDNIYDEAWRPTVEVFLPVQMCHVAVREGNRTWHGACHLDDALQAPEGQVYIDGYRQGARETSYADNQHIPGLDWGGWHDAGDHDLRAGCIALTTLGLALAQEEFGPNLDQTAFRRSEREVLLHVADGEQDMLQQIEFGVEGVLASYRVAGHIFPGIIESTRTQYSHTGDPVNITDNRIYDSSLKPNQVSGSKSGRQDDRWVFTNRNTALQYNVAQALAASSRVLGSHNRKLADESLAAAAKLWEYEQRHPAVYTPNPSAPRDSGFRSEEISATAELLLTTGEARYADRMRALKPGIESLTAEQFGRGPGWALVRLLAKAPDAEFRSTVVDLSKKWKQVTSKLEGSNPYRVRMPAGISDPQWKLESPEQADAPGLIWGPGWNLQTDAMHHYYFHKHVPEVFDLDSLLAVVNYVLGSHPDNNMSYVSAVGTNSALMAYGINRPDWSSIAGGVISGASLIRPAYMELKEFPFLWYQTEYVMHGASSYVFDVLAAHHLLNRQN